MIRCQNCNRLVSLSGALCTNCGALLKEQTQYVFEALGREDDSMLSGSRRRNAPGRSAES